jgi:DNA invertase Pin-like site-specific DNA recombinase
MALTNAQVKEILSKAGVDAEHMPEAVENIVAGHTASINALREERDTAREEAKKNSDAKKELDELQKKMDGKDPYKVKYEAIKEEFEEFKKGIETEKTMEEKRKAFKNLLKEIGISEKRIDAVVKVSDVEALELNKDGSIKDASKLSDKLKEDWSDFIVTEGEKGADTATPPANNTDKPKLSKEEIFKIKNTTERQAAIAAYAAENGGW